MEVVEPDALFRLGHEVDTAQIRLELYRLAAMFLSSGPVSELALEGWRTGKGMVNSDTHWMEDLVSQWFWNETSRILIYTAIQGRLLRSMPYWLNLSVWDEICGDLETGCRGATKCFWAGPLGGSVKPLTLKYGFDKIIHALTINPDVEALTDLRLLGPTRKNPILFLYGELGKTPWRATLKILEYVRLMRKVLVASGA